MAQKPRRDRRRTSQDAASNADRDVGAEPFGSDLSIGSGTATAAIGEVTPGMMDEAAHRAAEAVEAAAHHVSVETEPDHPEYRAEPVPNPTLNAATVSPVRSEPHAPAPEPEPSAFSEAAASPGEIGSFAVSSHGEAVEATPIVTLPPLDIGPSAPVEGAVASVAPGAADVGADPAAFTGDMALPAGVPTAATEASERTDETLRRSLPTPGETLGAYSAQVVDMLATNMAATGQFLTALMGATSVTEVVAVNTSTSVVRWSF